MPELVCPTFRHRPASLPQDAAAITALVRDYFKAYAGRMVEPPQNVVAELSSAVARGAGGNALAHGLDGELAGFLWWEVDETGDASLWCDVYAHPRASASLEHELVGHALVIARQWLAGSGRVSLRVESGTLRENASLGAALTAAGFAHARTFWQMGRDLTEDVASAGPAPAGLGVRQVRDDPAGRALMHRILETSFRDHWNHTERSVEEFWHRKEAHPGWDPSQWWVADLDGEPVGACIGDASHAADGVGYIATLGVLREGRGRGVGQLLLRTAFAAQRARGWTRCELGVDADSPTGATRLYRRVGMEPVQTFDLYAAVVEPIVAEPTTRVPS